MAKTAAEMNAVVATIIAASIVTENDRLVTAPTILAIAEVVEVATAEACVAGADPAVTADTTRAVVTANVATCSRRDPRTSTAIRWARPITITTIRPWLRASITTEWCRWQRWPADRVDTTLRCRSKRWRRSVEEVAAAAAASVPFQADSLHVTEAVATRTCATR